MYNIEKRMLIKGQYLYKEGDLSTYIYIVKRGDYEITKKIIHTYQKKEENIQEILLNPLKINKVQNKLFSKNTVRVVDTINVYFYLFK